MRAPARLLAALAVLAAPAAARAQFTVYTDLAAFLAATSSAGTDSFNDLAAGAAGTAGGPLARSAGAFGYAVSANTLGLYGAGPAADRWLTTDVATDVVTFTGFGPAVRGVGGFFFGTDLAGAVRGATSLTVRATGAGGTTTRTLTGATAGSFVGFVSDGAVLSFAVEVVQPTPDLAWPTVNNFTLAAAPTAAVVPEPSTLVLMGVGAAGMVARRARRRADPRPRP